MVCCIALDSERFWSEQRNYDDIILRYLILGNGVLNIVHRHCKYAFAYARGVDRAQNQVLMGCVLQDVNPGDQPCGAAAERWGRLPRVYKHLYIYEHLYIYICLYIYTHVYTDDCQYTPTWMCIIFMWRQQASCKKEERCLVVAVWQAIKESSSEPWGPSIASSCNSWLTCKMAF